MSNDKSKALVPVGISSWQELKEIATIFHKSGMAPKSFRTPEQVISACVVARDLGLPPSTVLQGRLYIVNGIVSTDSQTMMALILSSGQVKVNITKDDNKGWVEVTMERPATGLKYTARWDEVRVKKSRVNINAKTNEEKWAWKRFRQTMKTWRAIGEVARIVAPDLIGGIYLADEVDVPTRIVNGNMVIDVEAKDITRVENLPETVSLGETRQETPIGPQVQIPRNMAELYRMAEKPPYDISKDDAINVLTIILSEEIGPGTSIGNAVDQGVTVEELWEKLIAKCSGKAEDKTDGDPTKVWNSFLKDADITQEEALEFLGTESVNAWKKQEDGRNLNMAIEEIQLKKFLKDYNYTKDRIEVVLAQKMEGWFRLNPNKKMADLINEVVGIEGLDKPTQ